MQCLRKTANKCQGHEQYQIPMYSEYVTSVDYKHFYRLHTRHNMQIFRIHLKTERLHQNYKFDVTGTTNMSLALERSRDMALVSVTILWLYSYI